MKSSQITVSVITSCYRGEKYLASFFENVVNQTFFHALEVVFIHNDPTYRETSLVEEFSSSYPNKLKYIKVDSVENIGASWNRGWQHSKGRYLAIWNVDDQRPLDGIEKQARFLDNNPDCVLNYGDFLIVAKNGLHTGERFITHPFSKSYFSRSFQGGAFFMWRKNLTDTVGKFDEQLHLNMDFDLSIRIALMDLTMCRHDNILGYFTNSGEGASTRNSGKYTRAENTRLYFRYGAFDKIRIQHWKNLKGFDPFNLLICGEWVPISQYWPDFERFRRSKRYLWIFYFLRNGMRFLFLKIGLLQYIYEIQKKTIKKDI